MTPDREPVGQVVNAIISALDIIAGMALNLDDYAEVAAEEEALGRVISRAQLILSFIDTRKPQQLRQSRAPVKMRLWRGD
jgi:hypothetical protein